MYMINHSLNKDLFGTGIIISDPEDASTTNSVSSYVAYVCMFGSANDVVS